MAHQPCHPPARPLLRLQPGHLSMPAQVVGSSPPPALQTRSQTPTQRLPLTTKAAGQKLHSRTPAWARLVCGERSTTPTAVTCGNAELVIEENVQLGYPDAVE
jgi:hypothetical protein